MAQARVHDLTIAYEDEGPRDEGPPLVLVHGHPFDRSMWRPQVARFAAAGWRVVVPDLRGYGETRDDGGERGGGERGGGERDGAAASGVTPLSTFARDLAGLLDHLGLGGIVLGGLSMGGQIVMEFVRLFPRRVRGLLLADTSPRAETDEGRAARHAAADRVLREGMAGYADELLPGMVAPGAEPRVRAHVLAMMRAAPAAGAAAALRGRADRPDYVAMLRGVRVPALVVVGSEDAFTPVAEGRFLHGLIPGAALAVVDGAGHLPNLERPTEFDQALERLLAQVTATGSKPGGNAGQAAIG